MKGSNMDSGGRYVRPPMLGHHETPSSISGLVSLETNNEADSSLLWNRPSHKGRIGLS